ncbi:MAG: metallophosphoesterase [Thermoanaerobaculia bacterium]
MALIPEAAGYDLIGDIYGHADELRALLTHLGYREANGAWRHPERLAVFVGDFLDRGPKIAPTLDLVRAMLGNGSACSVLGNHEWNAPAPGAQPTASETPLSSHSWRSHANSSLA